jgi:hypothetical protein
MAVKSTDIFNSKALQNIPKLGFYGLKIDHLATLVPISCLIYCMRYWSTVIVETANIGRSQELSAFDPFEQKNRTKVARASDQFEQKKSDKSCTRRGHGVLRHRRVIFCLRVLIL